MSNIGELILAFCALLFVQSALSQITGFLTDEDNEVVRKGALLKDMFGSFNIPNEFSEVEKQRKRLKLSDVRPAVANVPSLTVQPCSPDALPWISGTGYCVPTNLLNTYCRDMESAASTYDCKRTEGNWCCYKPSPTAPPVISPAQYLTVRPCTPDTQPWIGRMGFCSSTAQLNTFCNALEIGTSNRDCPGLENWCCYKPHSPPAINVHQCTPNALPYIGKTGFCASTDLLNVYCTELEISISTTDCRGSDGNWCCYNPLPKPSLPYSYPATPKPSISYATTQASATVGYPPVFCAANPTLLQCRPQPIPTTTVPTYYAVAAQYPCYLFSYLPRCSQTTTTTERYETIRSRLMP